MLNLYPIHLFPCHNIITNVVETHLKHSATDLQDAIDALLASLSDGWIWQVS